MDALKRKFREGHHAVAIAECEALCQEDPGNYAIKTTCAMMHALVHNYARALELLHEVRGAGNEDADVLFNIAICQRELKNFEDAERYFKIYTDKFPNHSHGWAGLAESRLHLKAFKEGIAAADRAIKLDSSSVPAWTARGNCQRSIGQFENALASYKRANQLHPTVECWLNAGLAYVATDKTLEAIDCFTHAIKLDPDLASLRVHRGDAHQRRGKLQEAVADYRVALRLKPDDDETLKKAAGCLINLDKHLEVIELCQEILQVQPTMLTAKRGVDWVLSKLVPTWHVPMMNEQARNKAYYQALESAVTPEKVVFEIGTGSGLLAMMAARIGAKQVFTCEAVELIANTARKIVKLNNYQNQVTVLAKPSLAVQLETDLPVKADILVHEIFSSDLLAEHLLPAIEDAKQRLLKPDGEILPSAASIMIALVGGAELGGNIYVEESFGFDLREFNTINRKMQPLHRQDLATALMSDDVEAFRFDFCKESTFPPETKLLEIGTSKPGLCYGVIQWIRIEFGQNAHFENHPSQRHPISNWESMIYRFDEPVYLEEHSVVSLVAAHDRLRPWFELASNG